MATQANIIGSVLRRSFVLKFFDNLLNIRTVEKLIAIEYHKNQMRCPVHLSIGQEGVSTAVSIALSKKDYFVSHHRSHAHYLSKNGSIKKMINEIYGKSNGCSGGHGGSMHLIDESKNFLGSTAIVSSSIPVGVGYAEGIKLDKSNSKVCIFIGDASVEEGVFYESINYTVLKNLPVIFICENNQFSVYTHINARQPMNRKIFKMVRGIGIKSFIINETCPFNLYIKLRKIFKKFKNKPLFIEIPTYRQLEHCGVNNDDNLNYRKKEEIIYWSKKDPIELAKKYLKKNFKLTNTYIDTIIKKKEQKIKKIFKKS